MIPDRDCIDLRRDLRHISYDFFGKQKTGNPIVVWDVFSYAGKCDLQGVDRKMNFDSYQRMLFRSLIPFVPLLRSAKWKFQQDNAPSHTSKYTKEWLKREEIQVLTW